MLANSFLSSFRGQESNWLFVFSWVFQYVYLSYLPLSRLFPRVSPPVSSSSLRRLFLQFLLPRSPNPLPMIPSSSPSKALLFYLLLVFYRGSLLQYLLRLLQGPFLFLLLRLIILAPPSSSSPPKCFSSSPSFAFLQIIPRLPQSPFNIYLPRRLQVLLACLVAFAAAAPQFSSPDYRIIQVLRDSRQDQGDGNYNYEFETENGIYTNVEGRPGSAGQSNKAGSFRWAVYKFCIPLTVLNV